MEVPFDKLGAGQSGRLVYQVMGSNGPILNPKSIRFMDPNADELTHTAITGPPALQAGLAGAGLITSVMNFPVSVAIAASVAALHRKIDQIEVKIDHIVQKVDRIDTQVAENNLRHALDHMLRTAIAEEDRIDLRSIASIRNDLDRFSESLSDPLFLNFALVVSSDVRERVRQLYDLLYGVRKIVVQSYNLCVRGDPERVVAVNSDSDYFRFFFGSDLETLVKATTVCKDNIDVARKWYNTNEINQFKEMGLSNLDDFLPVPHIDIFNDVSDEDSEDNYSGRQQLLEELVRGWLHGTDGGLFYRTMVEMAGVEDGYENLFWRKLEDAEPCQVDGIDVRCEVLPAQRESRPAVHESAGRHKVPRRQRPWHEGSPWEL